jgi:hypothetical protein
VAGKVSLEQEAACDVLAMRCAGHALDLLRGCMRARPGLGSRPRLAGCTR